MKHIAIYVISKPSKKRIPLSFLFEFTNTCFPSLFRGPNIIIEKCELARPNSKREDKYKTS